MAKELKGTKTEANLMEAFAGESQARNKYTYYASKAKKEGYEQIAALFQETADQEKEHAEVFYKQEFEALGARVLVTTADGSCGIRGFVTAAIPEAGDVSCICACGPEPMLKAIYDATDVSAYFSFEERMGCGFGACVGCTCKTKYGYKRICKDGPVLSREEIVW